MNVEYVDPLIGTTAMQGAYDAASRMSNEMALWSPPFMSADAEILPEKQIMDSRVRDTLRNDALVQSGSTIQKDHIVGEMFMLNARPNFKYLGLDEVWAEEFQEETESKFTLYAESTKNYPDASRMQTLTGLVRLAVGIHTMAGEVLASVEWVRQITRPFSTALQMLDLDRLSNPYGQPDTKFLRRGVVRDNYGAPVGYHVRNSHPTDWSDPDGFTWKYVPLTRGQVVGIPSWDRLQMIHIVDQWRPDQSRGIAMMVAALKEMKMTRKFRDVVLQNAVLNASYAASIESDLPTDVVMQQAGGIDANAITSYATNYLSAIAQYTGSSRNFMIDGVKIPHFFPGTKMRLQNAGTPGGVGSGFEESLLRYISAALGVGYSELSKDYSKANYSNLRAELAQTDRRMRVQKRTVADRFASTFYRLWLEDAINAGETVDLYRYGLTPDQMARLSAELQAAVERWIADGRDPANLFWWSQYVSETAQLGTAQTVANLSGLSPAYAAARSIEMVIYSEPYVQRLALAQFKSYEHWTGLAAAEVRAGAGDRASGDGWQESESDSRRDQGAPGREPE